MDTESLVMKLTGAAHHIQMDLDDGCSNPVFWLGLQKMLSEAAGTIEALRQRVFELETHPSMLLDVNAIADERDALRQRVQELEQQAKERALQDLSDNTQEFMAYDKLQECQAREEKLRGDTERCYRMLLSEPDTKGALFKAENILREALALPNDDSALKEYRKQVLMDAAGRMRGIEADMLERMAEE